MKNTMVLSLGHLSNGELTIAAETLKHLPQKGINILFVSHSNGAHYLKSLGFQAVALDNPDPDQNRLEFERLVKENKIDNFLCADIYTMDYASTWTGFGFNELKKYGLPIGSFDQYEWTSTDFVWDFCGAPVKIKELINNCDYLVRPCPLNKLQTNSSNIIPCRLFGFSNTPLITKKDWRSKLGISADNKVLLTVNSQWEYIHTSKFPQIPKLMEWLPKIIHNYLSSIEESLTILHVGPNSWQFPIYKNINYKYFPSLSADLYRDSVFHSDLFFGTNSISITLSSAVFNSIPSILLVNLKHINFAKLEPILHLLPPWYRDMAQELGFAAPFRIFPWGWKRFLEPIFSDNTYSTTYVESPIFEPKKCVENFRKLLFDNAEIENLKRKQCTYFESLNQLPAIEDSFLFRT